MISQTAKRNTAFISFFSNISPSACGCQYPVLFNLFFSPARTIYQCSTEMQSASQIMNAGTFAAVLRPRQTWPAFVNVPPREYKTLCSLSTHDPVCMFQGKQTYPVLLDTKANCKPLSVATVHAGYRIRHFERFRSGCQRNFCQIRFDAAVNRGERIDKILCGTNVPPSGTR